MPHAFMEFPPFECEGEVIVEDSGFENSCKHFVESIRDGNNIVDYTNPHITMNKDFGIVYRVDFSTSNDGEGSVNRIMLWKANGRIESFVGLEIPAAPLK